MRERLQWGLPFEQMVASVIGKDYNFSNFLDLYLSRMALSPPSPCLGIKEFLQAANDNAIPVLVLSSSHSRLMNYDLKVLGLDSLLTWTLGSDQVTHHKPDPAVVPEVLGKIGFKGSATDSVVFIGDSLSDYRAAKDQALFCAVLSGTTTASEFIAAGVSKSRIASNLHEAIPIIFRSNMQKNKCMAIEQLLGEYLPLDNMYPLVNWIETTDGILVPTAEHAYMADRFTDKAVRKQIAHARKEPSDTDLFGDGTASKTLAHHYIDHGAELIAKTDEQRIALMKEVVRKKMLANPDILELLLSTGDKDIFEGNSRGDRLWGVDPIGSTNGRNEMGRILMGLRQELTRQ